MIDKKYYPYVALGAIILTVLLAYFAVRWYKSYKSETFDSMLDAVYKAPTQKTMFDADLSYNIDSGIVPTPNYDSTSWINNDISDYAYLNNIDNQATIPVGAMLVADNTTTPTTSMYDKRTQPITQAQSDYYLLDDGANGNLKFDYNRCSKSCCATNVWPVPFYSPDEETISGKDYIPTNMFCSNSISNGCLCATPAQITNLRTRGGNSPYFFN